MNKDDYPRSYGSDHNYTCPVCGAITTQRQKHTEWHESIQIIIDSLQDTQAGVNKIKRAVQALMNRA
jgi:hypothetical protein